MLIVSSTELVILILECFDKIKSHSHELINTNMVILKQNDDIELFTTFNHQSQKK
jgi:hypothetical protein